MPRARRKALRTHSISAQFSPVLRGKLYDGVTGHPYEVSVAAKAGGLSLSRESGWSEEIGSKYLKRLEVDGVSVRLARTDLPGWRLILAADAEPLIAQAV